METENNNPELVDLAALNKGLEDIMLKRYPGKITGKQHHVDKSDQDQMVFRFFDLEKQVLIDFLKPYSKAYTYEIVSSSDGKSVIKNDPYEQIRWYLLVNRLINK